MAAASRARPAVLPREHPRAAQAAQRVSSSTRCRTSCAPAHQHPAVRRAAARHARRRRRGAGPARGHRQREPAPEPADRQRPVLRPPAARRAGGCGRGPATWRPPSAGWSSASARSSPPAGDGPSSPPPARWPSTTTADAVEQILATSSATSRSTRPAAAGSRSRSRWPAARRWSASRTAARASRPERAGDVFEPFVACRRHSPRGVRHRHRPDSGARPRPPARRRPGADQRGPDRGPLRAAAARPASEGRP